MRRFEYVEGNSSKFWEIEQDGSDLNIRWGKIGTNGQSQTKGFADTTKATAALDKLVKEKTSKGYVEVGAVTTAGIGKSSKPDPVKANTEATPAPVKPTHTQLSPASVDCDTPPWLASGPVLDLPRDAMECRLSSRQFPANITVRPARQCWHEVRQLLTKHVQFSQAGSSQVIQPLLVEAEQRFANSELGGTLGSDGILLAVACVIAPSEARNIGSLFVEYLVAHHGLPYAISALIEAERYSVQIEWSRSQRYQCSIKLDDSEPLDDTWYGPFGETELVFRDYLSAAEEPVWTECVNLINASLHTLSTCRQPLFGLLLPDLPEFSNELGRSLAGPNAPDSAVWLQLTATDPDVIAALGRPDLVRYADKMFFNRYDFLSTLALERGVEAVPILEHGAYADTAADLLCGIGVPRAIIALAGVAQSSKNALTRFSRAVRRWPVAAIAALTEKMAASSKESPLFHATLLSLLPAHLELLPTLKPWLSNAAMTVLDQLTEQLANPIEVAEISELPRVLANPPWLNKRSKQGMAALTLDPLSLLAIEQWQPGQRERAMELSDWQQEHYRKAGKDMLGLAQQLGFGQYNRGNTKLADQLIGRAAQAIRTQNVDELIATWHEYRQTGLSYWFNFDATAAAHLPNDMGITVWNALASEPGHGVQYITAKYGLKVLPGLMATVQQRPTQDLSYALPFGAVELAPIVARAYAKLKTAREEAKQWLLRYPEHAACGLIAPALGKAGEARDSAALALRLLASHGHDALLMTVAGRYPGPEASAALRALLDEDPLDRCPTKIGKLPDFWQPNVWPRPILASNGKALPDEVLDHIGAMLRFPTSDGIYAGIPQLKEACTPQSLANFAWDCFAAWMYAGSPSKENWAFHALGLLGNDDVARKLTPYIRAWPGESQHTRAVAGLDVLANIGSDVALMLLNGIAQKVKFKGLQDRAREKIDQIAEARDLTTEELEDRLAPDLGLDSNGTLLLDFGPRQFRVGFDESLKPYVRDNEGARLADLPKPKKTDDAELSASAVERFKSLKKDARTIASQQVLRLEVAMCARRRWQPALFKQFLAGHPLVRHLVQRLVWGIYQVEDDSNFGGQLLHCFRVAEDGSFTTAEDDPFKLPEDNNLRIGLPHALELPTGQAAAFGQLLADYELLQPFPQIGRDTYALTADELATAELKRWQGVVVPTGRVLGLSNKGWRRGDAQDGGSIWYFTKAVGKKMVELNLDPGIIVGMVDEYPEQTLQTVSTGHPNGWGSVDTPEAFNTLDSIAVSELIRDMESLRA
ncbi:DUF4132 domain-containing protein [Chitinivorax sp. B]|uniref:WGR and DUF4132 domain-containing protein n=1 Tax=Chitinivorax sp. B TaxID=2502235 RepID=UPI0010F454CA|nr:DUF4132 domain-containing protein [Chitinivorax sp. B]